MTTTPKNDAPAFSTMERAALDGFLAGIALRRPEEGQRAAPGGDPGADAPRDPVAAVLGQDPAALSACQLALASLAMGLLPVGALSPQQKAIYGRQDPTLLGTLVVNITEAQRLLAPLGVRFDVPPERILELLDRKGAFATFELLGMQITNAAMDQRALCGAFLSFLLDSVVTAVDRRYHDPAVDRVERERLLDDFAPALLALDEVLRHPADRRAELGARREDLRTEATEAQADARLAETTLRLRQQMFVPRQELFAAARRHLERTDPQALAAAGGAGTAGAGALPPPTGSRRVPIV